MIAASFSSKLVVVLILLLGSDLHSASPSVSWCPQLLLPCSASYAKQRSSATFPSLHLNRRLLRRLQKASLFGFAGIRPFWNRCLPLIIGRHLGWDLCGSHFVTSVACHGSHFRVMPLPLFRTPKGSTGLTGLGSPIFMWVICLFVIDLESQASREAW